ncbi:MULTISPECIES: hypothetical protein [unclassified Cryobacterium]|uniref:hypothetical protein n=1 Tax=unclassified Cryobacterium TaxID=2649013 RepID=UPI00106CF663|nr:MULTISPECIES: hypothetical protein [unclassified Cryobacterium]TFB54515.1 hypothetical protein E3N94_11975 [Cryobacterium sp. Sr3]TFC65662.1 hypothetical protein E3O54_12340 [Cryobacterium sp. TMT2-4]
MADHGVSGVGAVLSALLLAFGAVLLTGCSGLAVPIPRTPSPTAMPTAAPTPTQSVSPPDPAEVTDIFLSATSIELRDASGNALSTFDYFQPASELVPALSLALGSAPIFDTLGDERHPRITYSWADFVVQDWDRDWDSPNAPRCPNTTFAVSAETVNGVHIGTVDGIAVGDNAAELEAQYPDSSWNISSLGQPTDDPLQLRIVVGHVSLPPCTPSSDRQDRTLSVVLIADDPLGPITHFYVPSVDSGA